MGTPLTCLIRAPGFIGNSSINLIAAELRILSVPGRIGPSGRRFLDLLPGRAAHWPGRERSRQGGMKDWRWPLVVLLVAWLGFLAVHETCRSLREGPRDAVKDAADAVGTIAERFHTGRITTTFTAALPKLQPGGAILELAAYEAVESFRRSDERSAFFDLVPLGTTVAEIRVPVTYRYHVRFDDPWHLEVRGRVCLVSAPRLRTTLPPAIHTDRMEKQGEQGWLRFDLNQQMDELEKSITPTLITRAGDPHTVALVRETCRTRVAEFVRDWLLREDQWKSDGFSAITVTFADEGKDPASLPSPTLKRE